MITFMGLGNPRSNKCRARPSQKAGGSEVPGADPVGERGVKRRGLWRGETAGARAPGGREDRRRGFLHFRLGEGAFEDGEVAEAADRGFAFGVEGAFGVARRR